MDAIFPMCSWCLMCRLFDIPFVRQLSSVPLSVNLQMHDATKRESKIFRTLYFVDAIISNIFFDWRADITNGLYSLVATLCLQFAMLIACVTRKAFRCLCQRLMMMMTKRWGRNTYRQFPCVLHLPRKRNWELLLISRIDTIHPI